MFTYTKEDVSLMRGRKQKKNEKKKEKKKRKGEEKEAKKRETMEASLRRWAVTAPCFIRRIREVISPPFARRPNSASSSSQIPSTNSIPFNT